MLFQRRSPTVAIPEANQQGPKYPEKVTWDWVRLHVPLTLWFWATGILFAAFLGGVQAARLQFVQELAWHPNPILPIKVVSDKKILADAVSLEDELKRASESARRAPIENCWGNAYNAASVIENAMSITSTIKTELETNISSINRR